MKKRIPVVGAVLIQDGKVLAAKRGADKSMGGYWEFPGGKIEGGETPEAALARELKEELLIEASIGEHVTTTEHEYDFAVIILSTYYCELVSGTPKLTEHEEVRWVEPAQLGELMWAPADIPAVEKIMNDLR